MPRPTRTPSAANNSSTKLASPQISLPTKFRSGPPNQLPKSAHQSRSALAPQISSPKQFRSCPPFFGLDWARGRSEWELPVRLKLTPQVHPYCTVPYCTILYHTVLYHTIPIHPYSLPLTLTATLTRIRAYTHAHSRRPQYARRHNFLSASPRAAFPQN
jgi:hypothetical protein